MIDCDLSQKLVVVQNYYWEKSQTGIIIVGKIPERIKLVGKISSRIKIMSSVCRGKAKIFEYISVAPKIPDEE